MNFAPTPGFDDLRITTFAPRTSAPVQSNFSATPVGYEIQSWEFANNVTERGLNGITQLPHAWLPGSPIYLHCHMSTTLAVAAGVDVGFFVSLMIQQRNQSLAAAYIGLYWVHQVVPVGGYGAKTNIKADDILIPAANLGLSAMIYVYAFRRKGTLIATVNAGDVTEAVNDVLWLHEVDFHVQSSRFGTNTPAA